MLKPIKVDKPYPTTEGITCDALSLRIISPAYASPRSELNTILQYVYHALHFKRAGYTEIAETLEGIFVSEMHHLNLLGETVLALGAPPIFAQYPATGFNFYNAKYVAYSSGLRHMLEDDILGEKGAISGYKKMLKCLKNEQVKDVIARILEDEELHLNTLMKILSDFKC